MTPSSFFADFPPTPRRLTRRFALGRSRVSGLLACAVLIAALCSSLVHPASAAPADAPVSDQLTAVAVQPFAVAESVKWNEGTAGCVCSVLEQPANLAWRSLNVPLQTPRLPAVTLVGLDVRLQI